MHSRPSSQRNNANDIDDIDLDLVLNPKKKKSNYGVSANPDIDALEDLENDNSASRRRQLNRGSPLQKGSGGGGGKSGDGEGVGGRYHQQRMDKAQQETWNRLFSKGDGYGKKGGKGMMKNGKGKMDQQPKPEIAKTAELTSGNISVHNLSRELGMKKVDVMAKIKSVLGVSVSEGSHMICIFTLICLCAALSILLLVCFFSVCFIVV